MTDSFDLASQLLHTCVLPDHDWENEAGIQRDPLPGDNYLIDVRPNVRRVLQMVKADGTASLDSFVSRHLSDGSGVLLDNADDIARELIKLVKERGRAHDWDNEPDITTIPPPPADDLAREPLLGLDSRYDGRWSVSHFPPFLDHMVVLTSSPFSIWE